MFRIERIDLDESEAVRQVHAVACEHAYRIVTDMIGPVISMVRNNGRTGKEVLFTLPPDAVHHIINQLGRISRSVGDDYERCTEIYYSLTRRVVPLFDQE